MNVFVSYAEDALLRELTPLLLPLFKRLLEEKHLYQAVEIPADAVALAAKNLQARNRLTGFGGASKTETAENYIYTAEQILSYPWSPDLEEKPTFEAAIAVMTGQKKDKPKCIEFSLPATIHTYCKPCKGRWPFNPVKTLGKTESGMRRSDQWFYLCYQCQSCKGEPVRFLIRRLGSKLRLCGRDPFEEVLTPDLLPKGQREHFSNALVAHQAGQPLAGIFMLRVFIEQYWRNHPSVEQRLKKDPRLTGDQMGETYAATLPVDFKNRFPSLADIYGRLSNAIHAASVSEELFDRCRAEIMRHFEARRVFSLTDSAEAAAGATASVQ